MKLVKQEFLRMVDTCQFATIICVFQGLSSNTNLILLDGYVLSGSCLLHWSSCKW